MIIDGLYGSKFFYLSLFNWILMLIMYLLKHLLAVVHERDAFLLVNTCQGTPNVFMQ